MRPYGTSLPVRNVGNLTRRSLLVSHDDRLSHIAMVSIGAWHRYLSNHTALSAREADERRASGVTLSRPDTMTHWTQGFR